MNSAKSAWNTAYSEAIEDGMPEHIAEAWADNAARNAAEYIIDRAELAMLRDKESR